MPSALLRHAAALDDLHAATRAPIAVRTPWTTAWERALGDRAAWVVGVGDTARLEAAVVLDRRRGRVVTDVVMLGDDSVDAATLPARAGAAQALATTIAQALGQLHGPWRLRLAQVDPTDEVLEALIPMLPSARVEPGQACPSVRLDDRPADAYASRNFRKEVAGALRRLDREGIAHAVEVTTAPDAALLDELEAVRRDRDHDLDRVSDLDDPTYARWWRDVVTTLAGQGAVEVAVLRCDGQVAAYDLGILDGAVYRLWDGRIAPAWRRHAPGQILDLLLLQRVAAAGRWERLDLGRGETRYKGRLADEALPQVTLRAWSADALRAADDAWAAAGARLRAAKDADPRLEAAWLAAKRRFVLARRR